MEEVSEMPRRPTEVRAERNLGRVPRKANDAAWEAVRVKVRQQEQKQDQKQKK